MPLPHLTRRNEHYVFVTSLGILAFLSGNWLSTILQIPAPVSAFSALTDLGPFYTIGLFLLSLPFVSVPHHPRYDLVYNLGCVGATGFVWWRTKNLHERRRWEEWTWIKLGEIGEVDWKRLNSGNVRNEYPFEDEAVQTYQNAFTPLVHSPDTGQRKTSDKESGSTTAAGMTNTLLTTTKTSAMSTQINDRQTASSRNVVSHQIDKTLVPFPKTRREAEWYANTWFRLLQGAIVSKYNGKQNCTNPTPQTETPSIEHFLQRTEPKVWIAGQIRDEGGIDWEDEPIVGIMLDSNPKHEERRKKLVGIPGKWCDCEDVEYENASIEPWKKKKWWWERLWFRFWGKVHQFV